MPLSPIRTPIGWSRSRVAPRRRFRPRGALGFDRLEPRLLLSDVVSRLGPALVVSTPSQVGSSQPAAGFSGLAAFYTRRENLSTLLEMSVQIVSGGDSRPSSNPTIPGSLPYQTLQAMGPTIAEVGSAHDTIAAAQHVPALPVSLVDGALSATDQLDLYAIPMSALTQALHVAMIPDGASTALPHRLWLLDVEGDLLGDWPLPDNTTAFSLTVQPRGAVPNSQLIFGISHGAGVTPDATSAPIQYAMIVEQQFNVGAMTDVGFTDNASSIPSQVSFVTVPLAPGSGGVLITPPPTSTPPSSAGQTSSTPSASTSTTPPNSVPTPLGQPTVISVRPAAVSATPINPGEFGLVPLPTRSAASFGGRLAEGSLAPPINRADLVMVDLNLIEMTPQSPAPIVASPGESLAIDVSAPGEHSAEKPPALVAVQGPGGFPILAAAIQTAQARPAYPLPELLPETEPIAASQGTSDPCPLPIVAPLAPVTSVGQRPARPQAWNERAAKLRTGRPGPLLFSLNIAATLAFGMLLPDLVATWRAVSDRRPLPRLVRFWVRKRKTDA